MRLTAMILGDGFAAICGIDPAALRGGMLVALLLAGAAGSLMHCVGMCGPLVLGQVADRMACLAGGRLTSAHRLRAGLLLPYHAGRVTTYALLGAASGFIGSAGAANFRPVGGALMLFAALLFLRQAVRRLGGRAAPPAAGWGRALARLAGRLDRTRPAGGFVLGLLLGLLPCGFLYAALAASAAAGGAGAGAAAMAAFGLGTVPALAALGLAGGAVGGVLARHWRAALAVATPWILGANAALLALLGVQALAG